MKAGVHTTRDYIHTYGNARLSGLNTLLSNRKMVNVSLNPNEVSACVHTRNAVRTWRW